MNVANPNSLSQPRSRGTELPPGHTLPELVALAQAWCRASRLHEASAVLRPMCQGVLAFSDPPRLRRAVGARDDASVAQVLDIMAKRTADSTVASRLSRAAELAWADELP